MENEMTLESISRRGFMAGVAGVMTSCVSFPRARPSEKVHHPGTEVHKYAREPAIISSDPDLAAGVSNMTAISSEDIKDFKEIKFNMPHDTLVRAICKGRPGKPLLIVSPGGFADKMGYSSNTMLNIYRKTPLHEYSLMLVDHPSSAPFYCDNGELSWGGVEEGFHLTQIADEMKQRLRPSSIHLIGISMGGNSALQAAYLNQGGIDSVLALSPVSDYLSVPGNMLCQLENDSRFGACYQSSFTKAIGISMLLSHFNEIQEKFKDCRPVTEEMLDDLFVGVGRYQDQRYMAAIFDKHLKQSLVGFAPYSLSSYLTASDAVRVIPYLETITTIIHAEDDNVVPVDHSRRLILPSYENSKVHVAITEDGGHFGFLSAYGMQWMGCIIKSQVDFIEDRAIARRCYE
jgi:pimeloyl-ACP methyl ester carboxylesterase